MTEVWYRYEDPMSDGTQIYLSTWPVLRHTPKGVWLKHWQNERGKFVLIDSHKQFACPTIAEAKVSYIRRKERQMRIFSARLNQAQAYLENANEGNWQEEPFHFTQF